MKAQTDKGIATEHLVLSQVPIWTKADVSPEVSIEDMPHWARLVSTLTGLVPQLAINLVAEVRARLVGRQCDWISRASATDITDALRHMEVYVKREQADIKLRPAWHRYVKLAGCSVVMVLKAGEYLVFEGGDSKCWWRSAVPGRVRTDHPLLNGPLDRGRVRRYGFASEPSRNARTATRAARRCASSRE